MAFTQTDIDRLDAAFKGGQESVTTSDGKAVKWRSVDDYMRLRALMLRDVAGSERRGNRVSYVKIVRDGGG